MSGRHNATKFVRFLGSSLDDLRAFPTSARKEAGFQLDKVQNGEPPSDWKPIKTVRRGVQEIRIRDEAGAFRIIYVTRFVDAVYVLYCLPKETLATSRPNLDLATKRYRDLIKELGQ